LGATSPFATLLSFILSPARKATYPVPRLFSSLPHSDPPAHQKRQRLGLGRVPRELSSFGVCVLTFFVRRLALRTRQGGCFFFFRGDFFFFFCVPAKDRESEFPGFWRRMRPVPFPLNLYEAPADKVMCPRLLEVDPLSPKCSISNNKPYPPPFFSRGCGNFFCLSLAPPVGIPPPEPSSPRLFHLFCSPLLRTLFPGAGLPRKSGRVFSFCSF